MTGWRKRQIGEHMTKDEALKLALGKIKSARNCHFAAIDNWLFEAEEILEQALATPPAQRTWVGLTDEEIWSVLQFRGYNMETIEIAKAIEAKLRNKNENL
jgi:hypothetical protein